MKKSPITNKYIGDILPSFFTQKHYEAARILKQEHCEHEHYGFKDHLFPPDLFWNYLSQFPPKSGSSAMKGEKKESLQSRESIYIFDYYLFPDHLQWEVKKRRAYVLARETRHQRVSVTSLPLTLFFDTFHKHYLQNSTNTIFRIPQTLSSGLDIAQTLLEIFTNALFNFP